VKGETAISILALTIIMVSLFYWSVCFPALMIVFVAPALGMFGRVFLTMPIGLFIWLLLGLMMWCLQITAIIKGLKKIGIVKERKK